MNKHKTDFADGQKKLQCRCLWLRKKFGLLYIKRKSPLLSLPSANVTGQMVLGRLYQFILSPPPPELRLGSGGGHFQSVQSVLLFLSTLLSQQKPNPQHQGCSGDTLST